MANLNFYNFSLLLFLLKLLVLNEVRIKRIINFNISKQIELETYHGIRHKMSLPVRGQRTRTNAHTRKSKRYKK
jgi:small subunit ribosomal protein S13